MQSVSLDPRTLLAAYAQGIFPMAEDDGIVRWYTADPRGVLPLDQFHVPGTLRQTLRQGRFELRTNTAFEQVMQMCREVRQTSWISDALIHAYVQLHRLGFAHSVESWQNDRLVGGLYGVSMGGAFFGESMFHTATDASKVALVHLVERLRERGYSLLDTQATTPHLRRFGAVDVPAKDYMLLLHDALERDCRFA